MARNTASAERTLTGWKIGYLTENIDIGKNAMRLNCPRWSMSINTIRRCSRVNSIKSLQYFARSFVYMNRWTRR